MDNEYIIYNDNHDSIIMNIYIYNEYIYNGYV